MASNRRPTVVTATAFAALVVAFAPDLIARATTTPTDPASDTGGWVRPVDAPVWSGFRTATRPDHHGVDLGASRGTPIRAASSGTVAVVACQAHVGATDWGCDRDGSPAVRGCGWYVDIRHPDSIWTRYCHLGRAPDVHVGDHVATGQIIGLVGSTGRSSAPHLHFEVLVGAGHSSHAVDPVTFMAHHGAPLGTAQP